MSTLSVSLAEMSADGMVDSLMHLARRGAYAALSDTDGGGLLRIYAEDSRRRRSAGPILPRPHLDAALASGLLAGGDGCFRLTDTGRTLVRRAHSARSEGRATAPPMSGVPTVSAAPSATPSVPAAAAFNAAESPLGWLSRRTGRDGKPFLGDAQVAAGERLRADLWRAQMTPRVTASWSPVPPSQGQSRAAPGTASVSDSALAARERAGRALAAVGSDYIDLLFDVLGHLKGLEEVERSLDLPPRSGKRLLQLGLTALARHYGLLPRPDVEAQVRSRLAHWGAPDYRPHVSREG